jgi:bacterioferritin-associated ferredoxin
MIVCVCHAVPEAALLEGLEAGLSAEEIVRTTRAGTSCGVCATEVARIVGAGGGCKGDGSGGCAGCPCAATRSAVEPQREAA